MRLLGIEPLNSSDVNALRAVLISLAETEMDCGVKLAGQLAAVESQGRFNIYISNLTACLTRTIDLTSNWTLQCGIT